MTSYSILPSRPIQPHIQSKCPKCSVELEFPIPEPPPPFGTSLPVRCFKCQGIMNYPFKLQEQQFNHQRTTNYGQSSTGFGNGESSSGTNTPGGRRGGGRKIGTQDNPLEMEYYEILGVSVTATDEEIKKAYRRLAIKHHPDKNRDDPTAEERFKKIAIAYQTLSDPALRKKYNEFGSKESQPEGGFVDPEEVFSAIFGGERFVPIIGEISLGKEMKAALQEADEYEQSGGAPGDVGRRRKDEKGNEILSPEEKARREEKARKIAAEKAAAREARVKKLVEELERKLSIFTESASGPNDRDVTNSWREICELEAEELKRESYGLELLHAIGFVYTSKAKHYLASSQTFLGMGGWLHNVQGKYHVFSETFSTLKSAIELKSVFDQIQAAERAGNLSPEEKKRLEEQAAEKGLQALFKGAKLEIESVLRETCDRALSNPTLTVEKRTLRAMALQILGEAYLRARGDGPGSTGPGEKEYIRVNAGASFNAGQGANAGQRTRTPSSAGYGHGQNWRRSSRG